MEYNKLLQQRNSFLKQANESGVTDQNLLQVINAQLASRASFVFNIRQSFLAEFLPRVSTHYHAISGQDESLLLTYRSQLQQHPAEELLQTNFSRDLALQRTTCGIHRDDLDLALMNSRFAR